MTFTANEIIFDHLTPSHVDTFLDSFRLALESVTELAQDWHEMKEFEKFHFRQDFTRAFGLRRTVGALYQANRLTQAQTIYLADLDRKALTLAADLDTVYEVSLRQLLDNLFRWGLRCHSKPVCYTLQQRFQPYSNLPRLTPLPLLIIEWSLECHS